MSNFSALTSQNFRLYILGSFFSLNGFWIQKVLIGWLSWELSQSPFIVGLAVLFTLSPTILMGPVFGVIVDKVDIKKAALLTYMSFLISSIIFMSLIIFNFLSIITLLSYCFIIGTISSANHPVRLSLGPRLVSNKDQYSSVVAFVSTNFNLARLSGPMIGGLIINFFGVNTCILVACLCFIPSPIVLAFLNPRKLVIQTNKNSTIFKEFSEGIQYIIKNNLIILTLLISSFSSFFGRGLLETLPILSEGIYNQGPSGLGLLTASAGVGALIASISKIFFLKQVSSNISIFIFLIMILISLNLIILGNSNTFNQCILIICFLGFFVTFIQINMQSGLQISLLDNFRGRIMSLWTMITFGSGAIGSIFYGLISEMFSINFTFILSGILSTLLIAYCIYYKIIILDKNL